MCTKGLKTDQIVASISTADSEEGRRRGKNKKDAKNDECIFAPIISYVTKCPIDRKAEKTSELLMTAEHELCMHVVPT